jgi:uncharacterized protein YbjT (DUF2867 family)
LAFETAASMTSRTVLLTGASGFVGRRLHPLLVRRGWRVRCLTRDARKATASFPDRDWVEADVRDAAALRTALEGCEAAFYLVHEMGAAHDFAEREAEAARNFADSARSAGVARVVYLGGVLPLAGSAASEHLRSRARVGEILRAGTVPVLELRASMIVGAGSLSYVIVRDLAARLPFMILPRWLDSRTEPVAVDDVLLALARGLEIPLDRSAVFDLPGPEVMGGREILLRTAAALELRRPAFIRVPVLTPRLSSLWVRFVTRAEWRVAREIVVGLTTDLLARDGTYWEQIDHPALTPFDEAVREAEAGEEKATGGWAVMEKLMKRYRGK